MSLKERRQALTIELEADQRKGLIAEVKRYFLDEHDEDYGDLRAGFILDFFVEHLGITNVG